MDAIVVAAVGAGVLVVGGLVVEKGHVDIAVGEEHLSIFAPPHFGHTEDFLVEVGELAGIVTGHRYMPDLGHDASFFLLRPLLCPSWYQMRT